MRQIKIEFAEFAEPKAKPVVFDWRANRTAKNANIVLQGIIPHKAKDDKDGSMFVETNNPEIGDMIWRSGFTLIPDSNVIRFRY